MSGGASTNHDKLIDQFSAQLSQSYEEANLLFRLSKLLNTGGEPRSIVQSACEQMAGVLPFGWLAFWFLDHDRVVPSLAGFLAATATLPFDVEQMERAANELASRVDFQAWSRVLVPEQYDLARLCESEVLCQPIAHDGQLVGIILCGNKANGDKDISSAELQFMDAAADFLGVYHANIYRLSELKSQYHATLQALSAAIDAKDPYTRGHSHRVAHLAAKLASAINLSAQQVETFRIAGELHDIGKIGVAEAVLCKQGRLTDEEFAQIKKHPEIGYRIVKEIPGMEEILPAILHHHESWDGRGYPNRLVGKDIPLIAQCLALADSFDAMSSTRSYRRALSRQEVLEEIRKCAGRQFNPDLATIFVQLDFASYDAMIADPSLAKAA